MQNTRKQARINRRRRIRASISGTAQKPRLSVFRSNTHFYMQVIDDQKGLTLASASSKEVGAKGKKSDMASEVGKKLAEKALTAGIKEVVFDRGGYKYHGRIKASADAARAAGLKF